MNRRITMQDVANAVGLSRMSVSLALRNDPRVAEATRNKVRAKAEEMGYKPNPMVSILMSQLRESHLKKDSPRIAYIVKSIPEWQANPTLFSYYTGAKGRCLELGYKLELFDLTATALSEKRLSQILWHRGITGAIVAPLHGSTSIQLEWERLAAVAIGYSMVSPILHRVANHQFHTILLALQQSRSEGFCRPGLALMQMDNTRVDQNWLAGMAIHQRSLKAKDRIPEYMPVEWSHEGFLQWLRKYQPDVVLGLDRNLPVLLRKETQHTGKQYGYIFLSSNNKNHQFAGVNQNSEVIGSAAVDLVVERLYHNQRGVPDCPKVTLIEGYWNRGHFYSK